MLTIRNIQHIHIARHLFTRSLRGTVKNVRDTFSEEVHCVTHEAPQPPVNVDQYSVGVKQEAPVCHYVQQSVTMMQLFPDRNHNTHQFGGIGIIAHCYSFAGSRMMGIVEPGKVLSLGNGSKSVTK